MVELQVLKVHRAWFVLLDMHLVRRGIILNRFTDSLLICELPSDVCLMYILDAFAFVISVFISPKLCFACVCVVFKL